VRFERRFDDATALIVATEGILTARLEQDPLGSDVRTIVIDEFHERSIHADVGLALARQAWRARNDLRIVIMSATLHAERVSAFLDDCPVVEVPGEAFPVDVRYRPGVAVEDAINEALAMSDTSVLAFLAGAPEIRRAAAKLAPIVGAVPVLPLHGGLTPDEQDRAIRPARERRIILATNLAETTLTVPDVRVVVDTGLHKVARYDAARGIDRLDLERISEDSATQRAGRAGRTARGHAVRLWDRLDRLRPHREPDIARVDLASVVMDILAWGGDPRTFEWFEAPDADAVESAFTLLRALEAVDEGDRLTPLGRALRALPLHPRLARLVHAGRAAGEVARAAALLSERGVARPAAEATDSDLLAAVEGDGLPADVAALSRDLGRKAAAAFGGAARDTISAVEFRRAVLAAYPDRVARRRTTTGDQFLLASGGGARLSRDSGVVNAKWIVAVDVAANAVGDDAGNRLALIRVASAIDPSWVHPTSSTVEHDLDTGGRVRAARIDRVGEIEVRRTATDIDPEAAARVLSDALLRRGPTEEDRLLLERLRVAGVETTFAALVGAASQRADRLDDVRLVDAVPSTARRVLDTHAPTHLTLPSGRRVRLDYRSDGRIVAAAKLQDVFGLRETPRVGPARTPVTFELLSPAGRPVQVTADLRGFWTNGYPEVRKALRARYPKHRWPEKA
jgi:ATP-dependent helicase HrpB